MKKKLFPPAFFLRFFRWYCRPGLRDHIEGDLIEVYNERVSLFGARRANLLFMKDVLLLVRPGIVKSFRSSGSSDTYGMYRNYLTIGWRNLVRQRGYSLINISGLAIGMTVAILNGLWIYYELSFNKYFENYDRIAQVTESGMDLEDGGRFIGTTMTYPLSTELINNYEQHFQYVVRSSWNADYIFAANDKVMSASGLFADEGAPHMFSFNMLQGSLDGLKEMNSVMLSASLAKKIFGDDEAVGRAIRINNEFEVAVTGVYEDFPHNTKFFGTEFYMPWTLFENRNKWIAERATTDWRNHFLRIYVQIPEGASFDATAVKVKDALKFHPLDMEKAAKDGRQLHLYPMSRWHLYPPEYKQGQTDHVTMIILIGVLGAFVLSLACINFMNLSTARAERRAKEVGIRKTIGSIRGQLIRQFFSESFLVVLLAFLVALFLTAAFLPGFNEIASKEIAIPWSNIWFWMACFGFVFVTSALAGSYPALYLSSFSPVKALKGVFRAGPMTSAPRKVLVVFQFSISVMLIAGTVIVYQQIQHAKDRPVGYDREGLLMINKKTSDFYGKYDILRTELKKTGVVFEVSESMGPVTEAYSGNRGWDWEGGNPQMQESFITLSVSHLHGRTAGWQFIQGRDFDPDIASDSSGLIITKSVARLMDTDDPTGMDVSWTWWEDNRVINYKVLGVIEDLVMDSPYEPTQPAVFYLKGFNGAPSVIHVRIDPGVSMSEALPKVEQVFRKIIPSAPFEYQFADDAYAKKFATVERIGSIALVFAVLAIFISCLGLLGLASFVAERRTKEIGIRKVLGASVAQVWKMLSKDFVILIVVSCMIGGPVAWYVLSNWLTGFDYRIDISPWTFVLTAGGAVVITLLTVSYQAIRAAVANPVRSLRSE